MWPQSVHSSRWKLPGLCCSRSVTSSRGTSASDPHHAQSGLVTIPAMLGLPPVFVVEDQFTGNHYDWRIGQNYVELNPHVVYYSLSGYGQTGPMRSKRGYDPILQAASGFMSVLGERDSVPPRRHRAPHCFVPFEIFVLLFSCTSGKNHVNRPIAGRNAHT